jgi:hypothetical protein
VLFRSPSISVKYFEDAKNLSQFKTFVEKGLDKVTGAANHIKRIKAVLRDVLEDKGNYKAVKAATNKAGDRFIEWLTTEELLKLSTFNLPDGVLRDCRDLFLLMAGTGLRISDAKRVTPETFQDYKGKKVIKLVTEKTDSAVIVPIPNFIEDMLIERGYELPKYTDPHVNRTLKELFALPELGMEAIRLVPTKTDNQNTTMTVKRSELITTRAAKVSFVMWLFEAGLSDQDISSVTGNTIKTLQHYKSIRPDYNILTIERAERSMNVS